MLDQQGYFGNYPEPVWYNPHGIENMMLLYKVAQIYRITLYTTIANQFNLHHQDGCTVTFTPSRKGLYKHHLTDGEANHPEEFWSIVTCK